MDLKVMDLKDRASALTESAKHRMAEKHAESLERENDRLKVEVSALRDQSDRDADRMERILDSLDEATTTPKKHRIRRLMTLSMAAGSAYVLGAKAGRERYDQLRTWWSERRTNGVDRMNEWGEDVTARAGGVVQDASQRAAGKVAETGDAIARKVDQVSTKAAGSVEQTGKKASKAVEDAGTPRTA
jgi:FtsZ-binding cell division protein ZapB